MNELSVRVESIFDVALSKLILDHDENIDLVSPGSEQQRLLGVEPVNKPHDLHIGDLEYRSGVQIKGESEAVKQVESLLREKLPDSVIFKHPIQQDAIYLATVMKYIYRKKLAILDLGEGTKGIMFNVETNVGEQHLVQIKELTTEKDKLPVCSKTITLSGNYVILEVGSSFVRVSRKIKGKDRKRLHTAGQSMLPPGFGIIIRTSANSVDKEEIQFEINKLRQLWENIVETKNKTSETTRLVSGELVSEIMLGNASKVYLDKIRNELEPTLKNYHHFKAYSMASGFTSDFAQKFIDKVPKEEMSETLEQMIIERDFPINNHVKLQYNYLDGTQDEIIIGNIVKNGDIIVTRKKLNRDHRERSPIYSVHEGDILETVFSYGSWTVHYRYYSGLTNDLIGEKLKIITPLDLVFRGRIRAFDMGMTIYKNAEGETTSSTDDSVSNMVERGMISKELDSKLGEVLRVAMKMINTSSQEILIHLGQ